MSYYQKTVEYRQQRKHESSIFDRLRDIPFWLWDPILHKQQHDRFGRFCCANHVMGLPEKPVGVPHPIYPWQKELYDSIYVEEKYNESTNRLRIRKTDSRYLVLLKGRGIGGTSLLTRLLIWDILRGNELDNTDAIVITGNRLEMSVDIIRRLKRLAMATGIEIKPTRENLFEFRNTRISALPSKALSSLRGYERVSWIIADEADYWTAKEGQELRSTIEPFKVKSDATAVLLSTPRAMWGLFWQLEKEIQDGNSMYRLIKWPYTKALGTIFSESEIQEARKSPSFEKEFNLSYTAEIEGQAFRESSIDAAINLGLAMGDPCSMSPEILQLNNPLAREVRVLGLDPAWSSSNFAYAVTSIRAGVLETLLTKELNKPDFNEACEEALRIYKTYNCRCILIDQSAPAVISRLKSDLGEESKHYLEYIATLKSQWNVRDQMELKHFMQIIPINFGAGGGRQLLQHTRMFLDSGGVAVHPEAHKTLVYALRTATIKPESGNLNKEATFGNDVLEAWMMCMSFYKNERRSPSRQ